MYVPKSKHHRLDSYAWMVICMTKERYETNVINVCAQKQAWLIRMTKNVSISYTLNDRI